MQYTEEQKASFKQVFAARRRRQIILVVPLVAIILGFALLADDRKGGMVLGMPVAVAGPAFVVLVGAAVVFSFWNWRCPACAKYLGKGLGPHFCPKCGVALQ